MKRSTGKFFYFLTFLRLMLSNDPITPYAPWFYTWVEHGQLAAFAWPQTKGNLTYMWNDGIRHIITLSPEKIPDLTDTEFERTYIPIPECHAPTIEDIFKFISTIQFCKKRGLPVGVHCRMGLGRTGVMVAVYLMYFHGMEPIQALRNLRYLRPGSVDSEVQEKCVLEYRPNAKISNDNRIQKITKEGNHLLSLLRGDNRTGVLGPPRKWDIAGISEC
ncbi:unnamed protein product [Acanthoscelides obtectus]|uniref:Tyrosine specific protein phosphatases domain-containing protein n=1 Tax=Acanthoscelides obtectus TaxID=200917 RepID=A0A9P0MH89_ACAOB|nr:unnamed protein product [Acanthoscelides obtectus]CAK1626239.1 Dual specificity protein phosphatase 23 [Acanthoscelides obtectus]